MAFITISLWGCLGPILQEWVHTNDNELHTQSRSLHITRFTLVGARYSLIASCNSPLVSLYSLPSICCSLFIILHSLVSTRYSPLVTLDSFRIHHSWNHIELIIFDVIVMLKCVHHKLLAVVYSLPARYIRCMMSIYVHINTYIVTLTYHRLVFWQ